MFGGPQSEQAASRLPSGLTGIGAPPVAPEATGQASGLAGHLGATPGQTGEAQPQSPFLPRPAEAPPRRSPFPDQPPGPQGSQPAGPQLPAATPSPGPMPGTPDEPGTGPFLRRPGQPPAWRVPDPALRMPAPQAEPGAPTWPDPAEPSGLPDQSTLPTPASWSPPVPGLDDEDAPSGLPPRPDAG
jgi:hypothetical protein